MPEPLVLGRIDESFHQVAAAVVEEVLLRLGHEVEVREGPHPQMYPLLERGELALFADSWLPGGHGTYWEQIRDRVVEVAPLFDGARFFWAVPGYVPADQVSALPDLVRPEVRAQMATLVVQGTTPGAGLTMRSRQLVRDYGLDEAGWSHEIGDLAAIIRTVSTRVAAGDWFVTPLWQPQYLNEVHDLRPLDDPLGVFPPPDRASLIAHRDSFDRIPQHTRDVLARIRLTVADVNAMDRAVNLDGLDPLAAARGWMDHHPDAVRTWLGRQAPILEGVAAVKLYDKALVTVDQMGNKLTRDRIREFCLLNCKEVFICYIATEHIIAGEVGTSLALGEHGGDADVTQEHIDAVQEYVDLLAAEGIAVHGRIITAAEYNRGEAIVGLAQQLGVDLTILNFEIGGARAKAKVTQQIVARNPRMAVLVARPTT